MPRLFAPNENHAIDWGEVDFVNGVAAVDADADTDWFDDAGYTIDTSKHVLTVIDTLTSAQLRTLCAYLRITIDEGEDPDTKYALIRAIEGSISTKYIAEVTASSGAGSVAGDTAISITGDGTYKYKTAATTAPAILYMDYPDSTWTAVEDGDEFTPTEGHDKITIVEVNDNGYVVGIVTDDITVNAG